MLCVMGMSVEAAQAIDDTQDTPAIAMTKENRQAIIQGLRAAKSGQWGEGRRIITQTQDKAAIAAYEWLYFTRSTGPFDFNRISAFIRSHPEWPQRGKLENKKDYNLIEQAELSMPQDMPDQEIIRWFNDYEAQTPTGMYRYVGSLVRTGQGDKAREKLGAWWPRASLDKEQQAYFLRAYGDMIDREAHIARLNTVLYRGQASNARVLANMIGKGYPALAEARLALKLGSPGVDRLVKAVPAHLQDDPGFMLERLRWRRENNMDFGAIEILHSMPPADQIPNIGEWWKERQIMVRRLMDRKDYKSAYLLASKHGLKEGSGSDFAVAEFMSGWLALRFNNQADKAFQHFESLYNGTSTPISRSRGAYWAGKASEKLGHGEIAKKWFKESARYQTAFYGQMAIGELDASERPPQLVPPTRTIEAESAFYNRNIVKAARYLSQAGFRQAVTELLDSMSRNIDNPEEYVLISDLAESLEHYHNAVRVSKKGLEKNIMMVDQAFPTILPRMKNIRQEWALVHGVIRQESQFDPQAESPVGARGLMQLMPATAKEQAKKLGLTYQMTALKENPDYNIALGSTYLQRLIDRYDGSYPLALAAYNGGMGNVDKWLAKYGDPRKGEIDMIDWIELIPFSETQNYVQRVMESTYIYRLKMRGIQESVSTPLHVSYR